MGRNLARVGMNTLFGAVLLGALASTASAETACRENRLQLRWDTGAESFSVEVADDTAERARGLMFRETLDLGAGMLFVYDTPHHPQFWMKNTLIPLDIIFADMAGIVTRVHANAVPGDLTPIDGGEGVGFVLEINAGLAERLGIGPGAEFRHPAISADQTAWPCEG